MAPVRKDSSCTTRMPKFACHQKNLCSAKVNCAILLPGFYLHWPTLIDDNTLLSGCITISLVLQPISFNNTPSANFVSTKKLLAQCLPSLKKAIHTTNSAKHIWLKAYNKQNLGLEDLNIFDSVNKKTYLQLKWIDCIQKALSFMRVLIILDKDGNPSHAKSHVLYFGILKTDTTPNPKDMC